jgi:hypothetical protein
MRVLRGFNQVVLYLDFDGVLHHEDVRWHPRRGAYMEPDGFTLFEHASLLDELLRAHPAVRIVLSTSWVRRYGCYGAAKFLPPGLRQRVVGATFHSQMNPAEFLEKPRGQQVAEDAARRCPAAWLALDDDAQGWPDSCRSNLLHTHDQLGISAPRVLESLEAHLGALHPSGSG